MEPNTISQTPAPAPVPTPVPAPAPARLEGPISLLKSAFGLFKSHWKILSLIVGIPSAVVTISQLITITKNPPLVIIGVLCMIVGVILSIAMSVASIDAIRKLYANPSEIITIKGQYKYGFSLFWSIILIMLLQGLSTMGATLLFLIPGIIVAVYLSVTSYVFVVEGKKGLDALAESYGLVKNYWWAVTGRAIALGLFMLIASAIVSGVMLGINAIFGFEIGNTTSYIVSTILNFIVNIALGVISGAYMYKLYATLKANRNPNTSTVKARKWFKVLAILGPILIIILITAAISLDSTVSTKQTLNDVVNQLQQSATPVVQLEANTQTQ